MRMLELFSGTGVMSETFLNAGHEIMTVELDPKFHPTLRADILDIDWNEFADEYGKFDVMWASPPCTTFSVASIGHHRQKNRETGECVAVSEQAKIGDELLAQTLRAIKVLQPKVWFIENPRAGMRTMRVMADLPRYTVTYCQYGWNIMKPTDIWTNHPDPRFKPACKNGAPCHMRSPRHNWKTGLQSLPRGAARAMIPQELCDHILEICEDVIE